MPNPAEWFTTTAFDCPKYRNGVLTSRLHERRRLAIEARLRILGPYLRKDWASNESHFLLLQLTRYILTLFTIYVLWTSFPVGLFASPKRLSITFFPPAIQLPFEDIPIHSF